VIFILLFAGYVGEKCGILEKKYGILVVKC
jgi:hypothetical protein